MSKELYLPWWHEPVILDEEDYAYMQNELDKFGLQIRNGKVGLVYFKSRSIGRYLLNPPKGIQIDHINRNPLDNRKFNLQLITPAENQRRKRGKILGTSQYKGVSWSSQSNKWVACKRINGKYKHLGFFDSEREAALIYDLVTWELYGDGSYFNFPEDLPEDVA